MDVRDSAVTSGPGMPMFYAQHRGFEPMNVGSSSSMPGFHPGLHLHEPSSEFTFRTPKSEGSSNPQEFHVGKPLNAPVPYHDEQEKKRRGRPRKIMPEGAMTLGLSGLSSTPTPATPSFSSLGGPPGSGSVGHSLGSSMDKRRGRPPGSGKLQQLASLGKGFLDSVGTGFTPHVVIIQPGEDVAARIMAFSHQGPRAVCILSASGALSVATLRQSDSSDSVVTYEGRFEILCLSGSYLLLDDGVSQIRNGGLCIALCGPDQRILGGSVGGELKAAGVVQVVVGSFMYAGPKKPVPKPEHEGKLLEFNSEKREASTGWPGLTTTAVAAATGSRSPGIIDINVKRD